MATNNQGDSADRTAPDLMSEHDVPQDQMEDLQRTLSESDEPNQETDRA